MEQVCSGRACHTETLVVDMNEVSHLIVDLYDGQALDDTETASGCIWIPGPNFG